MIVRGRPAIGESLDAYVIAEIGTNHNRRLETARQMLHALAATGCDCAKFQIYEPDEIVSARVRTTDYGFEELYGDIPAQEMFERYLMTPKAWFPELRDLCHALGMDFAATIHGADGLRWALDVGLDIVKIASMDHNNLALLHSLVNVVEAPILVSVGMAGLPDIDAAVAATRAHRPGVGLFHCCSIYPPAPDELRSSNIPFLAARYGVPVGLSDHTVDSDDALEARARGAMMFEKHVTLDRTQRGPDHPFAMEMGPFKAYVAALKRQRPEREPAGGAFLEPSAREWQNRTLALKSVISRRTLDAGHVLTAEDVYLARPGSGIEAAAWSRVLGCALKRAVAAETPLAWDDLSS